MEPGACPFLSKNIKHATTERIIKGKHIASPEPVRSPVQSAPHAIWVRPGEGELKLNIDGCWRVVDVGFLFFKSLSTAPEDSLCVVNDQPVGNPKRKV
jgi:hypothetical protein